MTYLIKLDTTDRYHKLVQLIDTTTMKLVEELAGQLDVVQSIAELLKTHKISVSDVVIEPNPGPGSFTGIKSGIAIANVFNFVTHNTPLDKLNKPNYGKEPNTQPLNT